MRWLSLLCLLIPLLVGGCAHAPPLAPLRIDGPSSPDNIRTQLKSDDFWLPDATLVDRVEQAVHQMPLPAREGWVATSLDTYGRYYTGVTLDGHKVIFGVFLSIDPARYPAGIHIVTRHEQPLMTGGGCAQLNVWYDVTEDRVTEFHCYGLG